MVAVFHFFQSTRPTKLGRKFQRLIACIFFAGLSLGPAGAAFGQSKHPGLRQLTAVAIQVESLDEDARACGISAEALDAAVRIPLSASRLKTTADLEVYESYLYVNVNVVRRPGTQVCIANVGLSLVRWVLLPSAGTEHIGTLASVWDQATLLSGSADTFGKRASDSLEGFAKQFVGAWLRVN